MTLPRMRNIRSALTGPEWARAGGMSAAVLALHVAGWVTLLAFVVPGRYSLGAKTFGIGIGMTAYTLGMRHAFDADHIAAIDNTTRKLMGTRQRPLSVGFFFSLGHSTIVFAVALLLSAGIRALVGPVRHDGSVLHVITNIVGTGVSGLFLYIIAALNAAILVGIVRVFLGMRRGEFDETGLERQLNSRGFMNRLLGRVTNSISKPWHMYPVGVLFGLGFDTATEVALLVLAGSGAASGLPWYAILCLPLLFAAGMSLFDTMDGCFMNFAYGWAFASPLRKVYYNITITGLSVAVAMLIGTAEILALAANSFGLRGPFWSWVAGLNLNTLGYVIVGLFVLTWAVALLIWRFGRVEQRWTTAARAAGRGAASEPAATVETQAERLPSLAGHARPGSTETRQGA